MPTYKAIKSNFNPILLTTLGLKNEPYYITYILNNIKMNCINKKWGSYKLKEDIIQILNLPVNYTYYSESMIRRYIIFHKLSNNNSNNTSCDSLHHIN